MTRHGSITLLGVPLRCSSGEVSEPPRVYRSEPRNARHHRRHLLVCESASRNETQRSSYISI